MATSSPAKPKNRMSTIAQAAACCHLCVFLLLINTSSLSSHMTGCRSKYAVAKAIKNGVSAATPLCSAGIIPAKICQTKMATNTRATIAQKRFSLFNQSASCQF